MFFKRLSDVYDEEYAVAMKESDGDVEFAQFPENHGFQVPEGCHWKDVRAKSASIGHALQKVLLRGAMDGFLPQFTITNRMTQAITRIERARLILRRSGGGHVCDNFETWFATASCDRSMTGAVTARMVSRQIATWIASFQTVREAA